MYGNTRLLQGRDTFCQDILTRYFVGSSIAGNIYLSVDEQDNAAPCIWIRYFPAMARPGQAAFNIGKYSIRMYCRYTGIGRFAPLVIHRSPFYGHVDITIYGPDTRFGAIRD